MEAKYKAYDHVAGRNRIRGILNQSDLDYQEKDSLPPRTDLTFSNGFYANCSALFVDIRKSSELPQRKVSRRVRQIPSGGLYEGLL